MKYIKHGHEHSFIPVTYIGMIDPTTGKCYFDEEKCTKCGTIEHLSVPKELNCVDFLKYFNNDQSYSIRRINRDTQTA